MTDFQHTIEKHEDALVVALKGKIISNLSIESIELDIKEQISKGSIKIVMNLNDLQHINSSGINFLIRMLTNTRIQGGDLVLANVEGNIKKMFEIAKLNEIFPIYSSNEEALNHFKIEQ